MTWFLFGMAVGGSIGAVVMALVNAASEADDQLGEEQYREN
jgi:hypothetical protein